MKKLAYLFVLLLIVGAGINFATNGRLWSQIKNSNISQQLKSSVQNGEFLPGPLRGSLDANNTQLTIDGVIAATNERRLQNGVSALHTNLKLDNAAEIKLQDMFKQQYFEHNSPQGTTPADVVTAAKYEYIVVGENLALGNFGNDNLLVEAWMNSPGHRANILHAQFQEIGVAVGKGIFEGREVWLAVQEFGTPLSSCPGPSQSLQGQIEANRVQIAEWQSELATRKQQLESNRYKSQEQYNAAVAEYNELANKTNQLIEDTRRLVDTYNNQVQDFNRCLEAHA